MVEVYTKKELDPQKRAAGDLEMIIQDDISSEMKQVEMSSVADERKAARVTDSYERTAARLLIFTTDVKALNPDSDMYGRLADISSIFSEVHVVVLSRKKDGNQEPIRSNDNLWLYPTSSRSGLAMIDDAKLIAEEQFEFAGGFRADIVISFDAYEAGMVAMLVAKKYNRPFQVHLNNDIFDKNFIKKQKNPLFKKWMAWRVFRNNPSVRVSSRVIAKSVLDKYPALENGLDIVPNHIDLAYLAAAKNIGVLSSRFPQYSFVILFVGPLTHESGAIEALLASADLLLYPSICLMYIGEGSAKKEIEKQAEAMGVLEQVVISPVEIDVVSAMKESAMLVFPDGKDADERVLLKAAAAGLPILTANSDFVSELFTDGESAFICEPGDMQCFKRKANIMLNENVYRRKFSRTAREDVFERVEQDVDQYKLAFKESVERVLYDNEN